MNQKFVIDFYVKEENLGDTPKISYKLIEYVWNYIEEKFLVPKKIWVNDKYTYSFGLWFKKMKPEYLYFQDNIFNTEDTKYIVLKFRPAVNLVKQTSLDVTSTLIYGQTPPNVCASMIYDVFASLILLYTKKLTPEDFIKEKEGLDETIINSFPFPASIEESNLIVIEEGEKVVYVK